MGVSMFGHIGPQAIVHATMVWYIFDVIWFIDLKLEQLIHWYIDHLIDWLIDWLIEWLIDWLLDRLTYWMFGLSIINCFIKNNWSIEPSIVQLDLYSLNDLMLVLGQFWKISFMLFFHWCFLHQLSIM